MTRADLGRAKVQGMLAAVSKVTVAMTMSRRNDDSAEASESVEVFQRRMATRQSKVRRDVAARWLGQAIMDPHGSL